MALDAAGTGRPSLFDDSTSNARLVRQQPRRSSSTHWHTINTNSVGRVQTYDGDYRTRYLSFSSRSITCVIVVTGYRGRLDNVERYHGLQIF